MPLVRFVISLFILVYLLLLFAGMIFSTNISLAPTIEDELETAKNLFVTSDSSNGKNLPSSCIDAVSLLSRHIRADQENYGLQPWSSSVDDGGDQSINFPGLDENLIRASFLGRRIFFWGDSTTRNLSFWLHNLLNMHDSSYNISSLSALKLSDANNILLSESGCVFGQVKSGEVSCHGSNGENQQTNLVDGTAISSRIAHDECFTYFQDVHKQIKDHKPEIVVANTGLWWLHFQTTGLQRKGCIAEQWIHYENWLENILNAAKAAGAKALFLKTTNSICNEKFSGQYATANRLYSMKDNETLSACFDDIKYKREIKGFPTSTFLSDADITNYCENGTLNEHGSSHLNQRLFNFVGSKRRDTSITLHLFDDNTIKSCEYTKQHDGRHYHPLNLIRIRLLGHMISCIDKKQTR